MSRKNRKFYGSRRFLNKPGHHGIASIIAEVENTTDYSDESLNKWYNPQTTLQLSDCDRHITLEIDWDTKADRINSLHKIDTILKTLTEFRDGLVQEQALFQARKRKLWPDEED